MELEIQQYEKAKLVREEQLDRLTQICQEQAVSPVVVLNLQDWSVRSSVHLSIYSRVWPAGGSIAQWNNTPE